MSNDRTEKNAEELLIVSLTPLNLERGALWFEENFAAIKKARLINPWWRENAVILEKDLVLRPGEFIRQVANFGYERSASVAGRGLFAVRGGVIEIWPVNTNKPYLVEFHGNCITALKEREESQEKIKPRFSASRSLEKLLPGNFVVHVDHGIGIFQGIQEEGAEKFFVIEYAPPSMRSAPDRLLVSVDQKNRLSPYVGFETPRIHRLGGTLWETTKRKAREDAQKLAQELLKLYTTRQHAERPPYYGDPLLEKELKYTFPYQETEDQLKAEGEILHDLEKSRPMDRILCGDVGFGKTELALRAALRVVCSGKQVALLAPTTVLAAQHKKTFCERFKDLAVECEMLSRITPSCDEKKILQEVKEGRVDCVIGTHRILSKDTVFKNLGLVIIDEEQRFGVKQKERFKELRAEVDILSLSATPIPRTLSLALAKLRDLSLIATPPPERLPVETFVLPYSKNPIKRAIEFELGRGGQVYFLHNRIETINVVRDRLKRLLSSSCRRGIAFKGKNDALIGVVHGRLKEKEIMRVMDKFRNKEILILLATTIIENGLDISSANTLIVDDATRLGLAEAHQLRGRIGRSDTKAYAYFLYRARHLTPKPNGAGIPAESLGTEKAAERLEALKEYSELGAGYEIALKDLEIRGAGNILGREQSGAINKVGLNLYCQMLAESVEQEKSAAHAAVPN
ncbi:MAG: DEAD/DEAH box helicase [Candidatus Sungiibacteriota bacterium]|uniref:DEAD/DEAH box helicase n=1 Tax=Candidatus Sungiibacteriota bacterium TaxID=2750080 RepID=A0A7T5RJ00_9BACT|nr:MAG: DEAD/DEAH box helicase [Candidatus Sungbacteria bacterium]